MLNSLTLLAILTAGQAEPGSPIIPSDPVIFDKNNTPVFQLSAVTSSTSTSSVSFVRPTPGGARLQTSTTAAIAQSNSQGSDILIELLSASSNENRFELAEKLAAQNNQRIIPFIGYIALNDNSRKAQKRALRILASFDNEKADNYLTAATLRLSSSVANDALNHLIAHKNAGVTEKLNEIIRDERVSSELQTKAIEAYNRLTGKPISVAKSKMFVDYFFPGVAGAFIGATTLQRLGTLGKSESGEGLGFFGGTLIGAGTGALLSDHFSRDDSLYYLSAAAWGLSAGSLLNESIFDAASDSGVDSSRRATLELLGELTLIGGAFLAHSSLKPNFQDVVTINTVTLTSLLVSVSAMELFEVESSSPSHSAALLATQLLGLGAGSYFTKDLTFTFGDVSLIGYGALETAFYAGIITDSYISSKKSNPTALLGLGIGAIGMTALSQYTDLSGSDVAYIGVSGAYGKMAGTGLSLLTNADQKIVTGAMLTGGLLGIVGATLTAEDTSFSTAQVILPPAATLIGFSHGVAIGAVLGGETSFTGDQLAGIVLTAGTTFGLGSAYLSRQYDVSTWDVTMTGLGWLWGLWYSGWSIALTGADQNWLPLAVVMTADLGAAATAYLIAPNGGNITPQVVGWASLGGLGASAVSVLLTALYTSNSNSLIISNLLGTTIGLGIGGYLAHDHYSNAVPETSNTQKQDTSAATNSIMKFLGVTASPNLDDLGNYDGLMVQSVFQLN